MGNIVIVFCVFRAKVALTTDMALAVGFPIPSYSSNVKINGLKTSDNNTAIDFYINTNGTLCIKNATPINTWLQCSGVYIKA